MIVIEEIQRETDIDMNLYDPYQNDTDCNIFVDFSDDNIIQRKTISELLKLARFNSDKLFYCIQLYKYLINIFNKTIIFDNIGFRNVVLNKYQDFLERFDLHHNSVKFKIRFCVYMLPLIHKLNNMIYEKYPEEHQEEHPDEYDI